MYKPRNKYFKTNFGNLENRILYQKTPFTPYEFMSLRYACCQLISEYHKELYFNIPKSSTTFNYYKQLKRKIKNLQRCIQYLDNWFNKEKLNG